MIQTRVYVFEWHCTPNRHGAYVFLSKYSGILSSVQSFRIMHASGVQPYERRGDLSMEHKKLAKLLFDLRSEGVALIHTIVYEESMLTIYGPLQWNDTLLHQVGDSIAEYGRMHQEHLVFVNRRPN